MSGSSVRQTTLRSRKEHVKRTLTFQSTKVHSKGRKLRRYLEHSVLKAKRQGSDTMRFRSVEMRRKLAASGRGPPGPSAAINSLCNVE